MNEAVAPRTRIKICGLTREQDVDAAVAAGVDAVGFVLYAKSPRHVTPERAAALARRLPPLVTPVLLFVNASATEIEAAAARLALAILQFHGDETPADCVAANLRGYPQSAPVALRDGSSRIFQGAMRHAPTWDDLHWLLQASPLPVWVKGVLHPDDARQLQAAGCAGLIVSNHGGRSLDDAPASLTQLPAIRAAVGAGYPLLLDGGVRSGSDAFKALALGANAVLVGRLQMVALAVAGALGVAHMLQLLVEELHATMAQAGCAQPSDITPDCLTPSC